VGAPWQDNARSGEQGLRNFTKLPPPRGGLALRGQGKATAQAGGQGDHFDEKT
jgi:hypothetical protein